MIVVGSVSGVQGYLWAVAEEGGRQARRLRARSFFLQLLAEVAALRVARALDWPLSALQCAAAGKFVLSGLAPADAVRRLEQIEREIAAWLVREAHGHVSFALAGDDGPPPDMQRLLRAAAELARRKLRPGAAHYIVDGAWQAARLVLSALDQPCELCRQRPSAADELRDPDEANAPRRVCDVCLAQAELGRRLPSARWLFVGAQPAPDDPVDGCWEAFPKYGKLGPDFGLDNVFKRPLVLLRPGATFRAAPPRPFLGRAVPMHELLPASAAVELQARGASVAHLAFGLAVPCRLPPE